MMTVWRQFWFQLRMWVLRCWKDQFSVFLLFVYLICLEVLQVAPLPNLWGVAVCDSSKHFSTALAPVHSINGAGKQSHCSIVVGKRRFLTCFRAGTLLTYLEWFVMGCGKSVTVACQACFCCGSISAQIFRRAIYQEARRMEPSSATVLYLLLTK